MEDRVVQVDGLAEARVDAVADEVPDGALPAAVAVLVLRPRVLAGHGCRPHLHPDGPFAAGHRLLRQLHLHERPQAGGRIVDLAQLGQLAVVGQLDAVAHRLCEEVPLAGEVIVHGGRRHLCGSRDVGHADVLVAVLREQVPGLDDEAAPALLALVGHTRCACRQGGPRGGGGQLVVRVRAGQQPADGHAGDGREVEELIGLEAALPVDRFRQLRLVHADGPADLALRDPGAADGLAEALGDLRVADGASGPARGLR